MGHQYESPPALEALVTGLGELGSVLGPAAAPRLEAVRARLQEAVGQRQRGDAPGAARTIARAMAELAALADGLDPAEGTAMRALAAAFGAALAHGSTSEMEAAADVMRERSGATKPERKR